MRIIGGKFKGRILQMPKNTPMRPTTDIAKEGLFNLLANRIDFDGVKVLDLFSGSGSISFEFASRGALEVTSVEIEKKHVSQIIKNIEELGCKNIVVKYTDAFRYLKKETNRYDVVFADAPFTFSQIAIIPDLVFKNDILNSEGLLIIEHSKTISFDTHIFFQEVRSYGSVCFSFLQKKT